MMEYINDRALKIVCNDSVCNNNLKKLLMSTQVSIEVEYVLPQKMMVNNTERILEFALRQVVTKYSSQLEVRCYSSITAQISQNAVFVELPHAEPRVKCTNEEL